MATDAEVSSAVTTHEAKTLAAGHAAATLAALNAKVSDANLDDSGDPRDPNQHALGGAGHSGATLAELNALVSDATLDDSGDSRTPSAHNLAGAQHSADTLANLNTKISDATLMDSIDEDDMSSDSATKVPTQQSVKKYVDDNVGDTFVWNADLSGTYDWKANGHESTDPTSGFEVYSPTDLADFTTLSAGSNVITFDVSASGADKYAYLIVPLAGLPDLSAASSIYMRADVDLDDAASNFDTQNDTLAFYVVNGGDPLGAFTEHSFMRFARDAAGNIEIHYQRRVNNADANGAYVNITNPKNAGWMQMVDQVGNQIAQFYESTGHNITQAGGLTQTTLHARAGTPHCWIWIRAKDGGQVKGTISAIKIAIK